MKKPASLIFDPLFRKDLLKLLCLLLAVIGTGTVFIVTPELSSPTLLSLVTATVLSPWVAAFERTGHSRKLSIFILLLLIGIVLSAVGIWGAKTGLAEWISFKEKAPFILESSIRKLRTFENTLKSRYSILEPIHPADQILAWGNDSEKWIVENGAAIMGGILTWMFIIPPLTFVLLNEGPSIRRRFFQLIPNRYFESFFLITTQITDAISDYVRAKLVEATIVGLLVTTGIVLVGAPYAAVLGFLAGITNIIPYLGPIIGAIPGIMIAQMNDNAIPVVLVYLFANVIDTVVIFPLVVAKLVKLHPLILIAVVMMGQHYHGLVGMLISIPIASALKVVFNEIYLAVYERTGTTPIDSLNSNPD